MKKYLKATLLILCLICLGSCQKDMNITTATPEETKPSEEIVWEKIYLTNSDYDLYVDSDCSSKNMCRMKLHHYGNDYIFEGIYPSSDCSIEDKYDLTADGANDILLTIENHAENSYNIYAFDSTTNNKIYIEEALDSVSSSVSFESDANYYKVKIGASIHSVPKNIYENIIENTDQLLDAPEIGDSVIYTVNSEGLQCHILCYTDTNHLLPLGELSVSYIYKDGKLLTYRTTFSALPKGENIYYMTNSPDWKLYNNGYYTTLENNDGRKFKMGDASLDKAYTEMLGIPDDNNIVIPATDQNSAFAYIYGRYAFIAFESPYTSEDSYTNHAIVAIDLKTGIKTDSMSMTVSAMLDAHGLSEDILSSYIQDESTLYRIDAFIAENNSNIQLTFKLTTYDNKIRLVGNIPFDISSGKAQPYVPESTLTNFKVEPHAISVIPLTDIKTSLYFSNILEKIQNSSESYSDINKIIVDDATVHIESDNGIYVATSIDAMGRSYTFPEPVSLQANLQIRMYKAGDAFIFSQNHTGHGEHGDTWIFTEDMVYLVEYPDGSDPTAPVFSFARGYDGNLHYSRTAFKYAPSQVYYNNLSYCTSETEFCRENGYLWLTDGKINYESQGYYNVNQILYIHSLFIDWYNDSLAQGGYTMGIGGDTLHHSLEDLLEYNNNKFETAY